VGRDRPALPIRRPFLPARELRRYARLQARSRIENEDQRRLFTFIQPARDARTGSGDLETGTVKRVGHADVDSLYVLPAHPTPYL